MKTKIVNLKYGAKLLHTYLNDVDGVSIDFIFNAGCLNDPIGKAGLAHFCEHAAFGFSTDKYSKKEREYLRHKYQYYNATTSTKETWFSMEVINNKLEEAIDDLTHSFTQLKYIQEEFDSEYKIICDEIITRKKINQHQASILAVKNLNKEKEYKNFHNSAAGDLETVQNITLKDIKWFIENYYTLNNLTILVTGNVKYKKLIKLINKYVYKNILHEGNKGFDFENYKGYNSPRYLLGEAVEKGKSYFLAFYLYNERSKYQNIKDVCVRNLLSSCLKEKAFEYFRTDLNLCYSCGAGIAPTNKYNEFYVSVQCQDENIDDVVLAYHNFLNYFKTKLNQELLDKYIEKYNEMENFDRKSISRISDSRYAIYSTYNKIIDKKEFTKMRNTITLNDLKDEFEIITKSKPYLIIISDKKELENLDYKEFVKNSRIKKFLNF